MIIMTLIFMIIVSAITLIIITTKRVINEHKILNTIKQKVKYACDETSLDIYLKYNFSKNEIYLSNDEYFHLLKNLMILYSKILTEEQLIYLQNRLSYSDRSIIAFINSTFLNVCIIHKNF